eukprot:TRINITY_DN26365_c0_g1_i1.p1 TRINITY_DN26365_c0_g1~~TRINITY_DN26365_c0_g1_i1.p1  ORF type:complete len:2488 (+),score=285.61 TRINITY_DN26365_c0_g1_i1:2576-10039(+)
MLRALWKRAKARCRLGTCVCRCTLRRNVAYALGKRFCAHVRGICRARNVQECSTRLGDCHWANEVQGHVSVGSPRCDRWCGECLEAGFLQHKSKCIRWGQGEYDLRSRWSQYSFMPQSSSNKRDSEWAWEKLHVCILEKRLVTCLFSSIDSTHVTGVKSDGASSESEPDDDDGLVTAWPYTITRLESVLDKRDTCVGSKREKRRSRDVVPLSRFVQIRGPPAESNEWRGRWSRGHADWSAHPDIAQALLGDLDADGSSLDDGQFWMSWDDFVARVDSVTYSTSPFVGRRTRKAPCEPSPIPGEQLSDFANDSCKHTQKEEDGRSIVSDDKASSSRMATCQRTGHRQKKEQRPEHHQQQQQQPSPCCDADEGEQPLRDVQAPAPDNVPNCNSLLQSRHASVVEQPSYAQLSPERSPERRSGARVGSLDVQSPAHSQFASPSSQVLPPPPTEVPQMSAAWKDCTPGTPMTPQPKSASPELQRAGLFLPPPPLFPESDHAFQQQLQLSSEAGSGTFLSPIPPFPIAASSTVGRGMLPPAPQSPTAVVDLQHLSPQAARTGDGACPRWAAQETQAESLVAERHVQQQQQHLQSTPLQRGSLPAVPPLSPPLLEQLEQRRGALPPPPESQPTDFPKCGAGPVPAPASATRAASPLLAFVKSRPDPNFSGNSVVASPKNDREARPTKSGTHSGRSSKRWTSKGASGRNPGSSGNDSLTSQPGSEKRRDVNEPDRFMSSSPLAAGTLPELVIASRVETCIREPSRTLTTETLRVRLQDALETKCAFLASLIHFTKSERQGDRFQVTFEVSRPSDASTRRELTQMQERYADFLDEWISFGRAGAPPVRGGPRLFHDFVLERHAYVDTARDDASSVSVSQPRTPDASARSCDPASCWPAASHGSSPCSIYAGSVSSSQNFKRIHANAGASIASDASPAAATAAVIESPTRGACIGSDAESQENFRRRIPGSTQASGDFKAPKVLHHDASQRVDSNGLAVGAPPPKNQTSSIIEEEDKGLQEGKPTASSRRTEFGNCSPFVVHQPAPPDAYKRPPQHDSHSEDRPELVGTPLQRPEAASGSFTKRPSCMSSRRVSVVSDRNSINSDEASDCEFERGEKAVDATLTVISRGASYHHGDDVTDKLINALMGYRLLPVQIDVKLCVALTPDRFELSVELFGYQTGAIRGGLQDVRKIFDLFVADFAACGQGDIMSVSSDKPVLFQQFALEKGTTANGHVIASNASHYGAQGLFATPSGAAFDGVHVVGLDTSFKGMQGYSKRFTTYNAGVVTAHLDYLDTVSLASTMHDQQFQQLLMDALDQCCATKGLNVRSILQFDKQYFSLDAMEHSQTQMIFDTKANSLVEGRQAHFMINPQHTLDVTIQWMRDLQFLLRGFITMQGSQGSFHKHFQPENAIMRISSSLFAKSPFATPSTSMAGSRECSRIQASYRHHDHLTLTDTNAFVNSLTDAMARDSELTRNRVSGVVFVRRVKDQLIDFEVAMMRASNSRFHVWRLQQWLAERSGITVGTAIHYAKECTEHNDLPLCCHLEVDVKKLSRHSYDYMDDFIGESFEAAVKMVHERFLYSAYLDLSLSHVRVRHAKDGGGMTDAPLRYIIDFGARLLPQGGYESFYGVTDRKRILVELLSALTRPSTIDQACADARAQGEAELGVRFYEIFDLNSAVRVCASELCATIAGSSTGIQRTSLGEGFALVASMDVVDIEGKLEDGGPIYFSELLCDALHVISGIRPPHLTLLDIRSVERPYGSAAVLPSAKRYTVYFEVRFAQVPPQVGDVLRVYHGIATLHECSTQRWMSTVPFFQYYTLESCPHVNVPMGVRRIVDSLPQCRPLSKWASVKMPTDFLPKLVAHVDVADRIGLWRHRRHVKPTPIAGQNGRGLMDEDESQRVAHWMAMALEHGLDVAKECICVTCVKVRHCHRPSASQLQSLERFREKNELVHHRHEEPCEHGITTSLSAEEYHRVGYTIEFEILPDPKASLQEKETFLRDIQMRLRKFHSMAVAHHLGASKEDSFFQQFVLDCGVQIDHSCVRLSESGSYDPPECRSQARIQRYGFQELHHFPVGASSTDGKRGATVLQSGPQLALSDEGYLAHSSHGVELFHGHIDICTRETAEYLGPMNEVQIREDFLLAMKRHLNRILCRPHGGAGMPEPLFSCVLLEDIDAAQDDNETVQELYAGFAGLHISYVGGSSHDEDSFYLIVTGVRKKLAHTSALKADYLSVDASGHRRVQTATCAAYTIDFVLKAANEEERCEQAAEHYDIQVLHIIDNLRNFANMMTLPKWRFFHYQGADPIQESFFRKFDLDVGIHIDELRSCDLGTQSLCPARVDAKLLLDVRDQSRGLQVARATNPEIAAEFRRVVSFAIGCSPSQIANVQLKEGGNGPDSVDVHFQVRTLAHRPARDEVTALRLRLAAMDSHCELGHQEWCKGFEHHRPRRITLKVAKNEQEVGLKRFPGPLVHVTEGHEPIDLPRERTHSNATDGYWA